MLATHNVLTSEASPAGYCLLKCLQGYVEHDTYLKLNVHTEETLVAGRRALDKFSNSLQVID